MAPGGLLILADVFKPIWADKSIPVPLFPGVHDPENLPPGGSWWAGWIDFWHRACYVDYRTAESLINAHDGLSVVHQERYLVPMHPSNDTEEREGLGAVSNSITLVCGVHLSGCLVLMKCIFLQGFCHAGIKPFVATGQFTRTQVEEWIRLIQREFETKPIYMAWDIACGVKSS